MNSRHLIAAAAIAALGSTAAFAAEPHANHAGGNTRAEVIADMQAARAVPNAEAIGFAESYGAVAPPSGSMTSRSEVTSQVIDSRRQNVDVTEQQARGEAWGDVAWADASSSELNLPATSAGPSSTSTAAVTVRPGYESGYATNYSAGEAYSGYDTEVAMFRANDAWGAQPVASNDRALSREEVMAELAEARASGELDARGELSGDIGDTKFGNLPQHNIAFVEQAGQQEPVTVSSVDAVVIPTADESSDSVVLWVPADGEAVTLQPGETLLLVPIDQADAE